MKKVWAKRCQVNKLEFLGEELCAFTYWDLVDTNKNGYMDI